MLKAGMKIELPSSGKYEVIEVTEFAAKIKSLNKRKNNFETATGEKVSFEAPGRISYISANSDVKVIK